MTSLEKGARLARSWSEYIASQCPEYFITLTFRYAYSDDSTEIAMRKFVRMILSGLPRRVRKSTRGVVLAEKSNVRANFESTYHFHILLWGVSQMSGADEWLGSRVNLASTRLFPRPPTSECTCAEIERNGLSLRCVGGARCRGEAMSGPEWVDCRRIISTPETVADYMVDDLTKYGCRAGTQLIPITSDGVSAWLD